MRNVIILAVIYFFAVPFGYYYGLVFWGRGIAGAMIGFLFGTAFTILCLVIVNKFAGLFGIIMGEGKSKFTLREELESDLLQIRYHKMKKEYDKALIKVNQTLKNDPDFPEVLFLKAQIVWEGFGNSSSALYNLEKIQRIMDKDSSLFRWSTALMEEIKAGPKNG